MPLSDPSRLVQTSRGWLVVGMAEMRVAGFAVEVKVFGEDGWQEDLDHKWIAKESDETLAEFLVSRVHLEESEADGLASQIQGPWWEEWLASGDQREQLRSLEHVALGFIIAISLVGLLALVGVVFLVWLVAT